MMLIALVAVPAAAGIVAFFIKQNRLRWGLLLLTSSVHLLLTSMIRLSPQQPLLRGWLFLDAAGYLFLGITSLLFFAVSIYGTKFIDKNRHRIDRIFTSCLLFFLSTMTLVTLSHSFDLLWVAVEATTLASAPLIYFHRHRNKHSLEATWKYLMICSVGIALALLGTFFLSIAAAGTGGGARDGTGMALSNLLQNASSLNADWLKAAFLFLVAGYGTKVGLAPMHTWLPDAHSESPSMVSALLSGALLNCSFLAILRGYQVCVAAGQGAFAQEVLIAFGLMSMGVAAVFIIRQSDYKRLLAYSSVEHMGILSLSVGIGGKAMFGGMLHAINHSMTKGMLFLVSGNILAAYGTKHVKLISGMFKVLPASGVLWIAGLLAITGSPPFGSFISEFIILKEALDTGHIWIALCYLIFLVVIFIGMATVMLKMVQGATHDPQTDNNLPTTVQVESLWSIIPPAVMAIAVLLLGIHLPPFLNEHLLEAAAVLNIR
ncbi:MAG: proton-conducting transporter membrane subunit [Bdellovibrionota bacterium]